MFKVIDVSHHEDVTSWDKVKASGVDGVIIRAGFGKNNIDETFKPFIEGAHAAGLKVGIFWFSYAYSVVMARKEAEYCYNVIKKYKKMIQLPVFFDWEYESMKYAKKHDVITGHTLIRDMTRAFMSYMIGKGFRSGWYTNEDYQKQGLYKDSDYDKKYIKWYARYTSEKQTDCDIWQYTETGKIPGIIGNVDVNWVVNTKRFYGGTPYSGKLPTKMPGRGYFSYGDGHFRNKALGDQIKLWADFLKWSGQKITPDKKYLAEDRRGTKGFQKKVGLPQNGQAGKNTFREAHLYIKK